MHYAMIDPYRCYFNDAKSTVNQLKSIPFKEKEESSNDFGSWLLHQPKRKRNKDLKKTEKNFKQDYIRKFLKGDPLLGTFKHLGRSEDYIKHYRQASTSSYQLTKADDDIDKLYAVSPSRSTLNLSTTSVGEDNNVNPSSILDFSIQSLYENAVNSSLQKNSLSPFSKLPMIQRKGTDEITEKTEVKTNYYRWKTALETINRSTLSAPSIITTVPVSNIGVSAERDHVSDKSGKPPKKVPTISKLSRFLNPRVDLPYLPGKEKFLRIGRTTPHNPISILHIPVPTAEPTYAISTSRTVTDEDEDTKSNTSTTIIDSSTSSKNDVRGVVSLDGISIYDVPICKLSKPRPLLVKPLRNPRNISKPTPKSDKPKNGSHDIKNERDSFLSKQIQTDRQYIKPIDYEVQYEERLGNIIQLKGKTYQKEHHQSLSK